MSMQAPEAPRGKALPFFARRDQLDIYEHLRIRTYRKSEFVATQVRRDQPGLGLTLPHERSDTFLASIFLGKWHDGDLWCDGRHMRRTGTLSGALGIYDLRQEWVTDLQDPFAAIHIYIPLRALNQLADELRAPPIQALRCPADAPIVDETMLHLASALLPVLAEPDRASALFVDYIFAAMAAHVGRCYGGLASTVERISGGLAPWQERMVKEMLLDDLAGDPSLSDLAHACGLSNRHLARAFKVTTGLPPHRWLLRRRIERAQELLERSDLDICDIALACGFADQSHLTRSFQALIGDSPGSWRRKRRL